MNEQTNDIQALAGRADQLIGALTNAFMSAAETAAERISLASDLAKVQQRMSAFAAVLECVSAQKAPLLEQIANLGDGPADRVKRQMLLTHVNILTTQELSILTRAGAPVEAAQQAITCVDTVEHQGEKPTHRRDGKRFVPANGTNGTTH